MQQVYSGVPENGLLHIAPVVQKEAALQYTIIIRTISNAHPSLPLQAEDESECHTHSPEPTVTVTTNLSLCVSHSSTPTLR
jgi:hypothetical protein